MTPHDDDATVIGWRPGQLVFERFQLLRIAGRGGMGVVWQAHDQRLDLPVALKVLPEILAQDPAMVADLRRETRRLLTLTHPAIVRAYDLHHDGRQGAGGS